MRPATYQDLCIGAADPPVAGALWAAVLGRDLVVDADDPDGDVFCVSDRDDS